MIRTVRVPGGRQQNGRLSYHPDSGKPAALKGGSCSKETRSGILCQDTGRHGRVSLLLRYPGLAPLTVPAHKPIKAVYVRRFLDLMTLTGKNDDA